MKLILARHGEAENSHDDSQRNLTQKGREDLRRMSAILHGTGWNLSEIRYSPVLRARQSAEVIGETLKRYKGSEVPLAEERKLSPGLLIEDGLSLFDEYSSSDSTLWVFHMPDVARLASRLLGMSDTAFYFSPGTMLAINLPLPFFEGKGMLVWKMQPEYIREVIPLI